MDNPLADPPMQLDWPAPLMTAAEVAAVLRVTPKTVRQHIRRGSLRALQIDGGPYRVRAEDAQRWVAAMASGATGGTQAVDRYARERMRATETPAGATSARRRRAARLSA
jgi:excisionase family DNA binding protein